MRRLLRERLTNDPYACAALKADGIDVWNLPDEFALMSHEGAIVTIIGDYLGAVSGGMAPAEALRQVHALRISMMQACGESVSHFPTIPSQINLPAYLQLWVDHANPGGCYLDHKWLDHAFTESIKFFEKGGY